MAQLTLAELLKGREKLAGQDQASEPQRMSVEEFRKMYATDVEKSKELTSATETLSSEVKDINSTSGDSLNSNIKKLYEETKKISKGITNLSKEDAKDVTEKALGKTQFKTMGERAQDKVKSFKDFFTLRGFLDKTGIVKTGTGGILDTALAKREARQESIATRMMIDPQMVNMKQFGGSERKLKAYLGKQFDKAQDVTAQMRGNEAKIERLKAAGYTEDQMGRTGLLKTRAALATEIGKYDKTLRVKGEPEKSSGKVSRDSTPNDVTEEENEGIARDEKVIALLGKIEENTRGELDNIKREEAKKKDVKKPEESSGGLDAMGTAASVAAGTAAPGLISKAATLGRGALAAVGGTAGVVVGSALLAGYAGKKFREHVEEKEAANLASDKKEISENPLSVEELRKMPDAGDAWKPADVKARSRLENLTELRIKEGQPFTQEQADLVKKKLDIVVPKELVGATKTPAASVTPSPVTPASKVETTTPTEASAVYESSSSNAAASMQPVQTSNVVVAPQTNNTVNNNTSSIFKVPARSNDITLTEYFKSRYA